MPLYWSQFQALELDRVKSFVTQVLLQWVKGDIVVLMLGLLNIHWFTVYKTFHFQDHFTSQGMMVIKKQRLLLLLCQ